MRRNFLYLITAIICLELSVLGIIQHQKAPPSEERSSSFLTPIPSVQGSLLKTIKAKAQAHFLKRADRAPLSVMQSEIPKIEMPQKFTLRGLSLKKIPFTQLPGWTKNSVKHSFMAFQRSCNIFVKLNPSHPAGSRYFNLKAKDWQPACKAALGINAIEEKEARDFFETWFIPTEFAKQNASNGLFTGYYMPQIEGSLTRTQKFDTPIYGLPKRTGNYTRQQIDQGSLQKSAPVLAWIDSPVDRMLLEIEGAGVIKISNGKKLYLGYAGENGQSYTSIGSVLIKKGLMTRDNASKTAIKRYLENHPGKRDSLLHQNKSFVFFEHLKDTKALGAQGMALTPGYSLAIDRKWIPLGAPLWLSTEKPKNQNDKTSRFERLMIAQDTGGAIRGMVRGDIFWGSGKKAEFLGENMKTGGRYWLLLPKHFFDRLSLLV
ncbi:MAG: MltA domain-containing protein [Tatlockia sp.]